MTDDAIEERMPPRGMTPTQVAEQLKIKPVTVRAWVASGKLVRQPSGLITNADLVDYFENRRNTRMAELQNRRWHRIACDSAGEVCPHTKPSALTG